MNNAMKMAMLSRWKDSLRGTEYPTCTYRSEAPSQPAQNRCAAQELPRIQEGAFFFTKKAYCVNQTACVAGGRKSVQTQPHPFSALKKALEIMGIQGESLPLGECSRAELSRSCPSTHAEIRNRRRISVDKLILRPGGKVLHIRKKSDKMEERESISSGMALQDWIAESPSRGLF